MVAAVPPACMVLPLVVPAVADEDVAGCQFVHLVVVAEVTGDGDLGGVVLAGGGVWHDVVGCRLVVGGFPFRVQLE